MLLLVLGASAPGQRDDAVQRRELCENLLYRFKVKVKIGYGHGTKYFSDTIRSVVVVDPIAEEADVVVEFE